MGPEWTIINVVIQAIAGILGAHATASAAHEHSFGFLGHSLVGLIAGALSGSFLQRMVQTTVFGTGEAMPVSNVEIAFVQVIAGAVVGGIAMLVIGLLRHEMMKKPGP